MIGRVFGVFTLALFIGWQAHAATDRHFYAGLGYYSENFMNRITTSNSGAKSLMGTPNYPILFKYDISFGTDWFFTPTFSYTLIPRGSADNSAKVTIWHLMLPFGKNMASTGSSVIWEWAFGPGILNYDIKGSGGIKQLSNGTSTSAFAVPGKTSTTKMITFNVGTAANYGPSRFGFDLVTESFLSNDKRTYNLFISYAYAFSGGY